MSPNSHRFSFGIDALAVPIASIHQQPLPWRLPNRKFPFFSGFGLRDFALRDKGLMAIVRLHKAARVKSRFKVDKHFDSGFSWSRRDANIERETAVAGRRAGARPSEEGSGAPAAPRRGEGAGRAGRARGLGLRGGGAAEGGSASQPVRFPAGSARVPQVSRGAPLAGNGSGHHPGGASWRGFGG